ncbi:transport permease protein [Clostridium tetani]|uniref:ABC transporter permease n=1 Tax=Clostridium tetani TaxID=1513 RepID=UPI000E1649FA|nr:ABC transporter permease [Clostridium tetani]RXI76960.1 ABC transporter permease [Clostridium tetani]WFN61741.1 ABC transporter permease [Clostridium tetani]SUY57764.1 ABC-type polysaccharide/polyol phosphate export system, permease component [Clostridium tetani]BDR70830.1 transport permease protein [Clostridium tetani]BEV20467.1 ABC transporter permease [Clostridium tetani]
MDVFTLLHRNIKWRFHNGFTIVMTILQPILWLVLYSAVAGQSMQGIGIKNYTAFILPGLIILVSFGACSSSGIMNYLMKTDGSFYRILIAPVKRNSIVLGQILEAVLCTFLEVAIMFIVSLFFGVKIASGWIGLLLIVFIVFLTAFFMSGLTYAISLCLPNEVIYETVMNAIVLPIFFLSTALFPADRLSGGLSIAVNLNPFTHIINVLRVLILQGDISARDVTLVFLLLAVMCFISFSWALHRLKKETSL